MSKLAVVVEHKLLIEQGSTLTVGQLRNAIASLEDDTPIYLANGRAEPDTDGQPRTHVRTCDRAFRSIVPRDMLVLF